MLVSICSLTMTPLPVSSPAFCARLILARTPADTTTRSAGNCSLSARVTPVTFVSPSMDAIRTPVRISIPFFSAARRSHCPACSSSCLPISTGAASRTVTERPDFFSSHAASSPRTPPPITTAQRDVFRSFSSFSTSDSLRIASTSGRPIPGIGGRKHSLPAA